MSPRLLLGNPDGPLQTIDDKVIEELRNRVAESEKKCFEHFGKVVRLSELAKRLQKHIIEVTRRANEEHERVVYLEASFCSRISL